MSSLFDRRLQALAKPGGRSLLTSIQRGIEKESLRIDGDGRLARTPHPEALGSALTHPYITTDYSEALLEFITPVYTDIDAALRQLDEIHRFSHAGIGGELLWAASMPCALEGEESIPVARYGSSNVARMKTVYRNGLSHRYGRVMQTIAGIHYNFSMPVEYWGLEQEASGDQRSRRDYVTGRYLDLIRNFRRHGWLLVYLFGAAPAVCPSFVRGRSHGLVPFDKGGRSLHAPFGTSLRMGDLGYSSNAQKDLDICYNSLDSYIETLREAILQPHPEYEVVGVGDSGHERQLNTSLLQIENEFYSPIRPKRVARSGEVPLGALRRGGIEYVEIRCVDLNPFLPLGIDAGQARFIDCFLLFCLLSPSGPCDDDESRRIQLNMERVVNRGREPGLELLGPGGEAPLTELAGDILEATARIADAMDAAHGGGDFAAVQGEMAARVAQPELTPSARMLAEMKERDLPFFHLVMEYSREWAARAREQPLDADRLAHMEEVSAESLREQARVEAADDISFEEYLRRYYHQYDELFARKQ